MIVAIDRHGAASKAPSEMKTISKGYSVMKKLVRKNARRVVWPSPILSMSPALTAQNGMGGENPDKAEMMEKLQKMSTELQLSAAQKQQMAPS